MGTLKLSFNGSDIFYRLHRNEGKETVVLLHPAFADSAIFEPQVSEWAERYQLILLDLPGHGSAAKHATAAQIKDVPAICSGILQAHGIHSCHIVGVSLGSLVAQAFADRYPDLTKSVTIAGGYSIHRNNKQILKRQRKEGMRWMLYLLFSMKRFRSYVIHVSCHTEKGRELFERGIRHFGRRSFAVMGGMNELFVPRSAPVAYPLLIVIGEHDLELIQESAAELHRLEPLSRLAVVPGAGHCVNADQPERFNALVDRFIAEL